MSTTVNSTTPRTTATTSNSTISNAVNQTLGKDDFLKLLTTELRNQDPLSPMDNKDFISQMAQFSSLEQTNNVAKSMEAMNNSMSMLFQHSLLSQGAALIGKQVAGMENTGESLIEGIVEAVKWLDGNPQLQLRMSDGSIKGMEMNEIISVTEGQQAVAQETIPGTGSESNSGSTSEATTEPTVPDTGSTVNEMQV